MKIGEFIKQARKDAGLTHRQLSAKIKQLGLTKTLSAGAICVMEQGDTFKKIHPDSLYVIAQALDLDFHYLMRLSGYLAYLDSPDP